MESAMLMEPTYIGTGIHQRKPALESTIIRLTDKVGYLGKFELFYN
jgi:hypothetical protein